MSKRRNRGKRRQTPPNRNSPSRVTPPPQTVVDSRITYQVESSFSGPLPPPEMMERYDQIIPGFSKRLLDEYTAQGAHRRGLEAAVISGDLGAQKRGQWIAAAMFISVVIGAIVCAINNQPQVAVALIAMDLGGFGGVYVWGRRRQERERNEAR